MTTKRRRTLPAVSAKVPPELKPLLSAIAEILETGEGVRGNPLDRKITLRDLITSGIARLPPGAQPGQGGLRPGVEPPAPDMSTPPVPEAFAAHGSFYGMINLSWQVPGQLYRNHAYTNVYRSEEDNFADAELIGREAGAFYSDFVRDDAIDPEDPTQLKGYYYWITFTSVAGVEGPPNSPGGTWAQPIQDVKYLVETLSKGLEDAPATIGAPDETIILHAQRFAVRVGPEGDLVYPLIIADVGGVPTVVLDTAIIRQGAIQEGQLGPITIGKLQLADGTPVTTIGGLIRADAIDADNLSVAEAARFYGNVQSGNYAVGSAGWRIDQAGTIEMNDGWIRGAVQIGGSSMNVPAGDLLDAVVDLSINIGNWTRPGSTLIDGNKIFTGDAYVDTLQIKGQAVTIGVSSYSQGAVVIPTSGFVQVQEVTTTRETGQLEVSFGLQVAAELFSTTDSNLNTSQGRLLVTAVLHENGAPVWSGIVASFQAPAPLTSQGTRSGGYQISTYFGVVRTPPIGPVTYVLEVGAAGGLNVSHMMTSGRILTVEERKR